MYSVFLSSNWIVQPVFFLYNTTKIYSTSTNSIFTSKPLASQTCFELKWYIPPVSLGNINFSNILNGKNHKHFPATRYSMPHCGGVKRKIAFAPQFVSAHWYVIIRYYYTITNVLGTRSLIFSLTMVSIDNVCIIRSLSKYVGIDVI